ncbi:MAG: hypothetical protein ACI8QC_000776 [Planctomycetota bacterium]
MDAWGAMRCFELILLISTLCGACASVPAASELLVEQHDTQDPLSEALAEQDAVARQCLALAESAPGGLGQQRAAARALVLAADLRLVAYQLRRVELEDLSVDELVELDNAADSAVKLVVLGLCRAGLEHGEAALELAPGEAEAACWAALNLCMVAWSEGPTRAVLNGRGPAIQKLTRVLVRDHPEVLGASPLRMRGRFLDRAPWPLRDRDQAVVHLAEAVRLAPTPLNWQFLGDAKWSSGDRAGAQVAWRAGALADGGSVWRRALNQARLDALQRAQD